MERVRRKLDTSSPWPGQTGRAVMRTHFLVTSTDSTFMHLDRCADREHHPLQVARRNCCPASDLKSEFFGLVARLDPGVPAHDALRLMVDIPTKAESQWPAREDRRVDLATSGSTRFRRMPTLYRCLRCGDLRSPCRGQGAAQRSTRTTRRG